MKNYRVAKFEKANHFTRQAKFEDSTFKILYF